jgi:hypothetical protein
MKKFKNMRKEIGRLIAILVFGLVNIIILLNAVKAQKPTNINLSLIIGVWSDKGKCSSKRYIFTKNGKYQSFFKEKGKFKLFFNGSYTRKTSNSFTITHNNFEDRLEISSLNSKSLTGTLFMSIGNDEAEPIYWQRCSTRQ